jgi:hypothetical protein
MAEGFAWAAEGDAEPTATVPAYDKAYLGLKKGVLKDEINEEILDLVDGKSMALANKLTDILKQMTLRRKLNVEAALHGNATGKLATCVSVDGTTVTVDSTRFLREGMRLDGYDAVPNQDANSITVSKILSATTFTASGTVSSIDSATVLYHEDSFLNGSPQGIENIVDDDTGTYQGLSRNTYPQIRAKVRDGSVAGTPEAFTNDRLIALLDDIEAGPANAVPDLLYCGNKVYNAIYAYWAATGQRTDIMPAKDGLPAGLKFVYHGKEIPIVSSSKANPYTIYAFSKGNLSYYGDDLGHFVKQHGSMFEKVANYHKYAIQYTLYLNFFSPLPCANGRLNDILHVGA